MKLKPLSLKAGISASKHARPYSKISNINGEHSLKQAAPGAYIQYRVRTRPGAKVFYFNFDLAKEMGLIPHDHPNKINAALERTLVETFGIVIINEYDVIHRVPIDKKDIRPHKYMATRYLQLQHPSRKGDTSGDGRSIWNGETTHHGTTWDITSCGTGATRLSPATAIEKKFFKTGDKRVSYGDGYNSLDDSFSAALMSEIFFRNNVETERTLVILEYKDETSICVRAGKNLLRPAHFFRPLKQDNLSLLRSLINYYIEREVRNGSYPQFKNTEARYRYLARQMALHFSKAAARFESDYIFCWMDWDGDNILCNGGIIDYGSVRQFGLYHHEYRYDDVDRYSTKIPEQKQKARYTVQTFAQIVDYLITGTKKEISKFKNDEAIKLFDKNFEKCLNENLLHKIGFNTVQTEYLIKHQEQLVVKFRKHFSYFEKASSYRGIINVPDGISCNAIFCMRDALRELPKRFLKDQNLLEPQEFINLVKSSYAKRKDLGLTAHRLREIKAFQQSYLWLMEAISKRFHGKRIAKTLLEINMRASIRNPRDRITGDGVLGITDEVLKSKKRYTAADVQQIILGVVQTQLTVKPQRFKITRPAAKKKTAKSISVLREYREGL